MKKRAHKYFDTIWLSGLLTRTEAYKWLSEKLGLTKDETHFSLMTDNQCKDAIYFCKQVLNDIRRLDMDFGVEPATKYYN